MTIRNDWASHLTDELRKHFESIGEDLVTLDVNSHSYKMQEKHFAALAWLEETRAKRKFTESRRFWAILITAALTLIATCVSVWLSLGIRLMSK